MHSASLVKVLQKERKLLEDFISLSNQQLPWLKDQDAEDDRGVLQLRADLMVELTAIDATLGTWIEQLRYQASITWDTIEEMRAVNAEIISTANLIIEIDEQMQALAVIRKAATNLSDIDLERKTLELTGTE
jgi:hypothetical protein